MSTTPKEDQSVFYFFAKVLVFILRQLQWDDEKICATVAMSVSMPKERLAYLYEQLQLSRDHPPIEARVSRVRFDMTRSLVGSVMSVAHELGGCACEICHIMAEENDPLVIARRMAPVVLGLIKKAEMNVEQCVRDEGQAIGVPAEELESMIKLNTGDNNAMIEHLVLWGLMKNKRVYMAHIHRSMDGAGGIN